MYLWISGLISIQLCFVFSSSSFRAAVYEHPVVSAPGGRILTRTEALALMKQNLDVFENQTRLAAQQGAQIIVFPEDGIHGLWLSRASIRPFLEHIPDPKLTSWVPCDDPNRFTPSDVLQTLSCMAQTNKIYVVANMGDKQPCDNGRDKNCTGGQYQYNTDVVFDPTGKLIARYHKVNLFYEYQFDAGKPEVVTFLTPFGEFGVITCFDFLFGNQVLPLVQQRKIGNIVGPTAWMDRVPLLAAIEFHSSFAMGLGVNFLTANIHFPEHRFQGSGIWTPKGPAVYYYSRAPGMGQLLVADIETVQNSNLTPKSVFLQKKNLIRPQDKTTPVFKSILWEDEFTFVPLEESSGHVSVCNNKLCCSLDYSMVPDNDDLYAFGALDGRHVYENKAYFIYHQVCALVRCAGKSKSSCGSSTKEANTIFRRIEITGNFSTSFVYPEVLLSENTTLKLAPGFFTYKDGVLETQKILPKPLLAAALYGRVFERDDPSSDLIG